MGLPLPCPVSRAAGLAGWLAWLRPTPWPARVRTRGGSSPRIAGTRRAGRLPGCVVVFFGPGRGVLLVGVRVGVGAGHGASCAWVRVPGACSPGGWGSPPAGRELSRGARSALAQRRHDALRRFCAKDPGALDRPGQRGTMPQPGETDSVTTTWSDLYPRGLACTFHGHNSGAVPGCYAPSRALITGSSLVSPALSPPAGYGGHARVLACTFHGH